MRKSKAHIHTYIHTYIHIYTRTWSKTILGQPSWWALPASWAVKNKLVKRLEFQAWYILGTTWTVLPDSTHNYAKFIFVSVPKCRDTVSSGGTAVRLIINSWCAHVIYMQSIINSLAGQTPMRGNRSLAHETIARPDQPPDYLIKVEQTGVSLSSLRAPSFQIFSKFSDFML